MMPKTLFFIGPRAQGRARGRAGRGLLPRAAVKKYAVAIAAALSLRKLTLSDPRTARQAKAAKEADTSHGISISVTTRWIKKCGYHYKNRHF